MDETTKILLEYRAALGDAKNDLLVRLVAKCRASVLPYILQLARTWHVQQKDMDQVESDFWNDAFMPSLEKYDQPQKASFTTFVTTCGRNTLVDFIRKQHPNTISLESLTEGSDGASDRLPELEDTSVSALDENILSEAFIAFQFRCGSEATNAQEQIDYADLVLKLKSLDEQGEDTGIVFTALDRALLFRLMARVDKFDHPPDIVPQEPSGPTVDLPESRLVALTTALRRAKEWKRWEAKSVGHISH